MRIAVAGTTDVGRKRAQNQDAFLLLPEEQLYCVADGMGGHASGEVASRIAVEELAEFYRMTGRDPEATWPFAEEPGRRLDESRLLTAVRLANLRILERSGAESRMRGMGTTLVCAHFDEGAESVIIGHVGDSRAYLLRDGAIRQLTEDHSLLNDYMRTRRLTPEEIEHFPHKNVIVRALGMKEQLEVDLQREPLRAGDLILLCCDGLSGMVPDERMAEIVRPLLPDLKAAAQALVDAANQAGGVDNITCVLAQLQD